MSFDKDRATDRAKQDLAGRLGVDVNEIKIDSVESKEFSDMSLGAPADGEMAAQMIAYGWIITLSADGKKFDYRADKYQIRLKGYNGANHVVVY